MYKQTEEYYKTQYLGFGTGSIYNYGCYLVSLCNGLNQFGHTFTPKTLNEALKADKLFTGEYKNYIDVGRLSTEWPDVFTSFKHIEPWNDMDTLNWYLSRDYVVVAKVDARGIGGSGTHFVYVVDTEGINAIIHDPWFGDTIPVKDRYNGWGNILGLRVFGVKRISDPIDEDEEIAPPTSDLKYTEEEMTEVRLERDRNWTLYQEEIKKNEQLTEENNNLKEENQSLRSEINGLEAGLKNEKESRQSFIDKTANILGSTADESSVIQFAEELISNESTLSKKASDLEKAMIELERSKQTKIDELKARTDRLADDNARQAKQIDRLQAELDTLTKPDPKTTRIMVAIDKFIKFFKGDK